MIPLSISPLNMVPASVFGVDHAPTMAFTTEAYTLSSGPPISVPVSRSIAPVPKRLGSDIGAVLETVSDNAVLTIVVANYWSFSTRLWPIVHLRPRCPRAVAMP